MRKQIGNITLPVTSGATFSSFLRVKLSAGVIALAGSTDDEIGVLEQNVISTDIRASVIPIDDQASRQGIAAGAITQFAQVYAAANGQLASTGTLLRGTALTAAGGAGSIFEYLPARTTTSGTVARTQLTAETGVYSVPVSDLKTHATLVGLGSAAGTPSGDMGLTPGTFGTNTPLVKGESASGASKSDACRFLYKLPNEYVAGGAVSIKIHALVSALPQVGATIVPAAYRCDGAGSLGSNLVTTGAATLTAAMADYSFTVTPTSLNPGDVLDIQITGVANDTGGTTGSVINIGLVTMLLDVQG
jgi:hypothetical protein